MAHRLWILVLCLLYASGHYVYASTEKHDTVDLAGSWQFALDRDDEGIEGEWYGRRLPDRINLPGVLQSQGYGNAIGIDTPWVLSLYDHNWYLREEYKEFGQGNNVKVPFVSQPPRHYLGAAWYQRTIEIPEEWKGRRMGLLLERTRWKTTVWIDDREVGSQDSLVAPHMFELGTLEPGDYQLTIRVDNRMQMNYRPDGHSVSDSLGSTWNGIVGALNCSARRRCGLSRSGHMGTSKQKKSA